MTMDFLSGKRDDLQDTCKNLKQTVVRGGLVSVTSQFLRQAITLFATIVMARLLTPADYGKVAMVAAIVGMLEVFKELGLSTVTVQAPELDHSLVNALFWINTLAGIFFALFIVCIGPFLSRFYGQEELTGIASALAIGFLAAGLCVQHWALLRRKMRFFAMAKIEVAAVLFGTVGGIIGAWAGLGYNAILIFLLLPRVVIMIGAWLACDWRPTKPKAVRGIYTQVAFGLKLTANNLLAHLEKNVDRMLIGRVSHVVTLGLYTKSLSIILLPVAFFDAPLNQVLLSALSRLQNDHTRFMRMAKMVLSLLTCCCVAVWMIFFLLPEQILRLILGAQWLDAADYVRWLSLLLMLLPLKSALTSMTLSMGGAGRLLRWNVLHTVFILFGFAIGILWGVRGLIMGYVLVHLVLLPGFVFWVCSCMPLTARQFFSAVMPHTVAGGIFAAAAAVFSGLGGAEIIWPAVGAVFAYGVWVVLFLFLHRERRAALFSMIHSLYT